TAMNPDEPDMKPMNPFDFWAGANFKLKIFKADGYRKYTKTTFILPTEGKPPEPFLGGDDKKLEAVWKSEHSLQQFIASDQFKSYEDLKSRLDKVVRKGSTILAPGATA